MDFDLSEEQAGIMEAVDALLNRYAGPARAIALQAEEAYDHALEKALEEAGFLEVGSALGRLEGVLLVERVAYQAGTVAVAARVLGGAALGEAEPLTGPVAMARIDHVGPIRFGSVARTLWLDAGDEAFEVEVPQGVAEPVRSNFGFPMGRLSADVLRSGRSLGPGSGALLREAWRLGLAAETVGAMDAALAQTVAYLKDRRQFGRTIGSFQAVQHRLAECAIEVEASRWLVREAAGISDEGEAGCVAAAFALDAAGRVFAETHQLSGAIGFTREHDLHVWSMRLHALRQELGGVQAHRKAIVDARWREVRP
jgi:alkylation response protein AidB-like acyl-CoA dehydrogenase